MQNKSEIFTHIYTSGEPSMVLHDWNEAIEYLNDYARSDYEGTFYRNTVTNQVQWLDMTEYLEAFLEEQQAWQKHIGGSIGAFHRI